VTQSRNLGLPAARGLKRPAGQRKKCDENGTHRENDDDLTSRSKVCTFNAAEVFGMDSPENGTLGLQREGQKAMSRYRRRQGTEK